MADQFWNFWNILYQNERQNFNDNTVKSVLRVLILVASFKTILRSLSLSPLQILLLLHNLGSNIVIRVLYCVYNYNYSSIRYSFY